METPTCSMCCRFIPDDGEIHRDRLGDLIYSIWLIKSAISYLNEINQMFNRMELMTGSLKTKQSNGKEIKIKHQPGK